MAAASSAKSLRILCIDGGGIKGYTALLILRRIFRTIAVEGQMAESPRPCDIFDLIAGTSTGGLIAVMLGRLHMTVDECIAVYEQFGKDVFGKRSLGGQFGRMIKGIASSPFYDISILQEQIRKILESKGFLPEEIFVERGKPTCKVILCATRVATGKPDVLRSYESFHPTAENYSCRVWEAASATAAAPMYFKSVKFDATGEKWCDGGLRRNNPINEALAELGREEDWKDKEIGCLLSLGTGAARVSAISSHLGPFLKGSLKIMTDAEDIAKVFAASVVGTDLLRTDRYFRLNVPQGMEDLQLDEWAATERMRALTTEYLSHVGSGDLIQKCAKSLLYPDENLQIVLKPKQSIIPFHPCIHFVNRPLYTKKLHAFFSPHMEFRQIFALWGIGGAGKTQIALEFAESMKSRLSVFWIRADSLTNFIADYSQILSLLDYGDQTLGDSSVDTLALLEKTRKRLEQLSGDWLLILDNADHLDQFLGIVDGIPSNEPSISKYIPRRGRILITTRDRRFQGSVAAASDGFSVDPMTELEAEDLLLKSVPDHLIKQHSTNKLMAVELLEELGYLPLAIAQAAANIVDQQLSFAEYVRLFREKKNRVNLMQNPAYDFVNSDPRNGMQNVAITWQISIDVLKKQSPQSVVFMHYLSCFHWRNIPRIFLQSLPELKKLDVAEFIRISKRPLSLSLIEELQEEDGYTTYSVHPLLHEIIINETSKDQMIGYLEPVVQMMSSLFPPMSSTSSKDWALSVFLAPHAARQVELSQAQGLQTEHLAYIMFDLSRFYGLSSMFNAGADIAVACVQMASKLFGLENLFLYSTRLNEINRLNEAARFAEAEQANYVAVECLNSADFAMSLGKGEAEKEQIHLMSTLATSLRGLHQFERLEEIHSIQLQNQHVNPWSENGIMIRHNLAHTLLKKGRPHEAAAINDELLLFSETDDGKNIVGHTLHLTMLNLRGLIIRGHLSFRDHEEDLISLYRRVFRETIDYFGIRDVDTWKAINNLLGVFTQALRIADMGPILLEIIPLAIDAKVKAEGVMLVSLGEAYSKGVEYLEYISKSEADSSITKKIKELLEAWFYISGLESADRHWELEISKMNIRGVFQQRAGRYEDAERLHHKAIELAEEHGCDINLKQVMYYNLMLAMGSSGKYEEALALREQDLNYIAPAEAVYGSFENRMGEREDDFKVYYEAKDLIEAGKLTREDEWWMERYSSLHRAEHRFGALPEFKNEKVVKSSDASALGKPTGDGSRLGRRIHLFDSLRKKNHGTSTVLPTP